MGIWLDELEREVRSEVQQVLRDRRALRLNLAAVHNAVQEGQAEDSALLLLDALPRPGSPAAADESQTLLHRELARLPHEAFALRRGQSALLLQGPVDADKVKRMLVRINRRLQLTGRGQHLLVFGAARAAEARRNAQDWLALADLRLQMRLAQLGLPSAGTHQPERRRATRR